MDTLSSTVRYAVKIAADNKGEGWARAGVPLDHIVGIEADGTVQLREQDGHTVLVLSEAAPHSVVTVLLTVER